MKNYHFILLRATIAVFMLLPIDASAITGYFDDPSGGQYWCNVLVSSVSSGKSYSWCTGDDEDTAMDLFRGFETEHAGTVSTENPSLKVSYRYHRTQSKEYNYDGSDHEIYVMLHGGRLHKIAEWKKDVPDWTQTDFTYGAIGDVKRDGEWFSFRFAPNERGIKDVVAIQIENDTYYHQHNVVFSDYYFTIHARYLRSVTMDLLQAHDATVAWNKPGKVTLSADNGWLPQAIGNNVDHFKYVAHYNAVVNVNGNIYSSTTLDAVNTGNASVELAVPLDKDFTVEVTRNTETSFQFYGTTMTQNLNENVIKTEEFLNNVQSITASYNQVDGSMLIDWNTTILKNTGEWKIYRTELDENGKYIGNRELVGTSSSDEFTDNTSRGLVMGKYYRYEVYHHEKSWPELDISTNPEPLTVVHAAEVHTSTVPVIPLTLVQDEKVTDKIKMDWTFGNVPKEENDITFKVHRIEPNGTITHNYMDVTVPRNAGKASFSDEKPESMCSVYGYFVQLDLADNKIHLYSDTVSAHVHEGTTVTRIDATKGTGGNAVVVKWKAKQVGTTPTLFDIQRRFVDSGEWVSIHEQEGTGTSYSFTDNTAEPGRFYDYKVVAYAADCDDESHVISNAMTDVGYTQATGVVSGRVQFDTGTAVDNVRVALSRESDEHSHSPYFSRHIIDDDGGIVWQTDTSTVQNMLSLTKPFTIQMWINPNVEQVDGSYLFSIQDHDAHPLKHSDGYSVRLRTKDDGYGITINSASDEGISIEQFLEMPKMEAGNYSHLTVRNHGNGELDVIVNGDIEHKQTAMIPCKKINFLPANGSTANVVFASGSHNNLDGEPEGFYKGYIDEVRLWNRAITDAEITTNYNRILSGREEGLKLYWTFDEGLEQYAFDNSMTNGVPNGNHAMMGNTSRPSEIVPDSDQLSSYGITNDKGEYEIRGIPFTGSGTRYSVYPTKGVHKFTPTSRSAFIGGTSLNINNADFTDVYSAGGQLLQSHTPADTRATINLCHLTEGIYFVSACTHNGTRTIKKIIKR
ncbi:MAG: T9SS type A sorting domain-containing protein [Muribaculaceae bacterium]|nr:T9SS type A sorting domain-containing protein [Muribaculaceae bacterium]